MPAYEVSIDNNFRNSRDLPDQSIPETEKTPEWYYQNLNYALSFFNQPVGQISFSGANTSDAEDGTFDSQETYYPVQFMIKMIMYYLGKQPNLDYNHVVHDVTTNNVQANWIKGQETSEFVNHFKGLIMQRLSHAKFSGDPMSKDAKSKRDKVYNSLMLRHDMKEMFKALEGLGVSYKPEGIQEDFELPEDVEKWMDTNYKEYGAIIATKLANGLWFTNSWAHKCMQAFMHVTITSLCGMEHYVSNGRTHQRIRMPYQMIIDNRQDDDFGRYDQFIGSIDSMTPNEIFLDSRFSELSEEQKADIQEMARDQDYGNKYNISPNVLWFSYGQQYRYNTISVATVYWRGQRDTGKRKGKNRYGKDKIEEGKFGESDTYKLQDIYKATLIGNKYLVNIGLVDNIVEDCYDKSVPCFPITRFRPNTFMGESISEVHRIHKLQNEIDLYDFKIRDMVGKAKGKVYIISDKFADVLPKEFVEDVATIGIHVARSSGEAESQAGNGVEMIDWTLDPNIGQLVALYRERKERMGKILSSAEITRGQQTKYVGLGVLQGTINQNSVGQAYLIDGFMDWIVMNMRYAVNQAKNLYASKPTKEIELLIGDRGVEFLKFTKDMTFESFFISLTVNNMFDEQKRERILKVAQADAQNGKMSTADYLKLEDAESSIEVQEYYEYKDKKSKQEMEKAQAQRAQIEQQMIEREKYWEAQLAQLKEDNANFRSTYTADMQAATKGISDLLKHMPQAPKESDINNEPQQPQRPQ